MPSGFKNDDRESHRELMREVWRKRKMANPGTASPGGLRFQLSLTIRLAEMKDWPPERIAMLFRGIAQVYKARNDRD